MRTTRSRTSARAHRTSQQSSSPSDDASASPHTAAPYIKHRRRHRSAPTPATPPSHHRTIHRTNAPPSLHKRTRTLSHAINIAHCTSTNAPSSHCRQTSLQHIRTDCRHHRHCTVIGTTRAHTAIALSHCQRTNYCRSAHCTAQRRIVCAQQHHIARAHTVLTCNSNIAPIIVQHRRRSNAALYRRRRTAQHIRHAPIRHQQPAQYQQRAARATRHHQHRTRRTHCRTGITTHHHRHCTVIAPSSAPHQHRRHSTNARTVAPNHAPALQHQSRRSIPYSAHRQHQRSARRTHAPHTIAKLHQHRHPSDHRQPWQHRRHQHCCTGTNPVAATSGSTRRTAPADTSTRATPPPHCIGSTSYALSQHRFITATHQQPLTSSLSTNRQHQHRTIIVLSPSSYIICQPAPSHHHRQRALSTSSVYCTAATLHRPHPPSAPRARPS